MFLTDITNGHDSPRRYVRSDSPSSCGPYLPYHYSGYFMDTRRLPAALRPREGAGSLSQPIPARTHEAMSTNCGVAYARH